MHLIVTKKKYIGTYITYIGFNKSIDIGGFDGFVRVLIKNSESSKIDIAQAPYGVVIEEYIYNTTNHEKKHRACRHDTQCWKIRIRH